MRINARVDANQRAIRTALQRCGCRVLSLAPLGKGVPDLLVTRAGQLYLLELKTPTGRVTPYQEQWHAIWPVSVVHSEDEALAAVGLLKEGA